jgi:hypothetical protein
MHQFRGGGHCFDYEAARKGPFRPITGIAGQSTAPEISDIWFGESTRTPGASSLLLLPENSALPPARLQLLPVFLEEWLAREWLAFSPFDRDGRRCSRKG